MTILGGQRDSKSLKDRLMKGETGPSKDQGALRGNRGAELDEMTKT